ncbi:MAG TPA: ABC transporter permease [Thermoleophilia bacterium]|jgi:peptide/nickel transport system permease protein|nr:ABC transporter permease [Thermoleophilia bacterium]
MLRLIGRRLLLMVPTLILASLLIFALAEVLPGDVGRSILGPYATQEQVQLLNEKLGADRPLVVRYASWAGNFVTGDWGESALQKVPVRPLVLKAFGNSLILAGFALVLIVPTSIVLGVFSGLRRDSVLDRTITVSTLSMTVIPEFVSGVVLLYVFAVWLKWLPVSALPPDGSNFLDRLYYLILPAIPLMFLELGYISRMARVGTVQVLSMPYIRTAVLKGVPRSRVIFGHVLRNAMVPTVTVIGSQVGWLIGGLVVVETLFVYPGVGKLMVDAAKTHDVPVLEASVLMVAIVYMLANLVADIIVALLNPRIRMGG